MSHARPTFQTIEAGKKAPLPFPSDEYAARLTGLRAVLAGADIGAAILTAPRSIAYYGGTLTGARGHALVVQADRAILIAPAAGAMRASRGCAGEVLSYSGAPQQMFWQAVAHVTGAGARVGIEADHMTLQSRARHDAVLRPASVVDIAAATRVQRINPSDAERALIRDVARIADVGAYAARAVIGVGVREIDVAAAGRAAMEAEIARAFPGAAYSGTRAMCASGLNTDSGHAPVTGRVLEHGDIVNLHMDPVIHGYCAPLTRTLFVGEVADTALSIWKANVAAYDAAIRLIRPGVTLGQLDGQVRALRQDRDVSQNGAAPVLHVTITCDPDAADLADDGDTVLRAGMVVGLEQALVAGADQPGAGGYREQDVVIVGDTATVALSGYPTGPAYNVVR
jgi:creatinase